MLQCHKNIHHRHGMVKRGVDEQSSNFKAFQEYFSQHCLKIDQKIEDGGRQSTGVTTFTKFMNILREYELPDYIQINIFSNPYLDYLQVFSSNNNCGAVTSRVS